jgi:NitT/TauT family transport system ATP-binding protein
MTPAVEFRGVWKGFVTRDNKVVVALEDISFRVEEGEFLALVGPSGCGELSGGMRKRVALATMLAYDPSLLLMDEPFGALDAQTRLVLQDELLRLWQENRKTVDLPRPRSVTEARSLDGFDELYAAIWNDLKPEIRA